LYIQHYYKRRGFLVFAVLFLLVAVSFQGVSTAIGYDVETALNDSSVQVLVNGQQVSFPDATPFIDKNGRVQAPARFVAQALGAQVAWDGDKDTAYITGQGKSIALFPGHDAAKVNGAEVKLDSGALLINDRVYVPVRFIAENLGAVVQWDENVKAVKIIKNLEENTNQEVIGFGDLQLSGFNNDLLFAPDGKVAVFSGYNFSEQVQNGMTSRLLMLDLDGESISSLDGGGYFRVLGWDSAGENVLYTKDGSLYRLSVKDGKKIIIADNSFYGAFSPDGNQIAYAQRDNGLWLCDLDGSEKRDLTSTAEDWYPVWYPDGKSLFYFNDLGAELGDGAGHLQGMAKLSLASGNIESILPEKRGKFRSAQWITPGKSLYVASGWDDGYFHHILDLDEGKITNLGESVTGYYAIAIDNINNNVIQVKEDGIVEIYNASGELLRSFEFYGGERIYQSAACTPDGNGVLVCSMEPSNGQQPAKKRIDIIDTWNGSCSTITDGENLEACYWLPGEKQILVLTRNVAGSSSLLAGFELVPVN